jgi:undecaprenyl-diphosphatase
MIYSYTEGKAIALEYRKHFCNRGEEPAIMPIEQIIILAIVQGITEFLPISSSGHLIILPQLTGWHDQGLLTDVMVHVGSLFAIIAYFWRDVLRLLQGGMDMLQLKWSDNARLAGYILLATIPAVLFGLVLRSLGVLEALRSDGNMVLQVVGWGAIFYAVLMLLADRLGRHLKHMQDLTLAPVLGIGIAQALALIPGTSRSGITMTAARALGLKRTEAARFSFLLGIPAIAGAGLLTFIDAYRDGGEISGDIILTAILTFFSALAAITLLMSLVKRVGFLPFVIYRLALGAILLFMAYG